MLCNLNTGYFFSKKNIISSVKRINCVFSVVNIIYFILNNNLYTQVKKCRYIALEHMYFKSQSTVFYQIYTYYMNENRAFNNNIYYMFGVCISWYQILLMEINGKII